MIGRRFWHSETYRWVYAPLALGAVISLLLLGNSFRDYRFVSRLLAAQGVRHQMRLDVATLEGQLRRSWKPGESRLKLLREDIKESGGEALWIGFHDPEGRFLEEEGDARFRGALPQAEEAGSLRTHDPAYRVVSRGGREAVVEAFPLRGGPPPGERFRIEQEPRPQEPRSPRGPPGLVVVEIAMPLTPADGSVLRIQRWNLFVASAGALALLSTVLIAGFSVRSYVKGRLLEQQVDLAREVQARLLPRQVQEFGGVRAAMEYRPAEQVGGDFYDVFAVGKDKAALVIGDVSGKGVPAAILMGVIHGAVRSSAWTESREDHERETLRLNSLLCGHAEDHRYATMFWCYHDRAEGILRYVNAGHAPPLLVTRGANGVAIVALEGGGPVIGLLPETRYVQTEARVSRDDLLVMCSDGLLEATRADGEEYGEERLRVALAGLYGKAHDEVLAGVLASMTGFLQGAVPHDDLTLVVTRFG